jgi:hypothetical protein
MHIFDFSEDGLLILKKLIGECLAKCPQIFYLIIFRIPGMRLEWVRSPQNAASASQSDAVRDVLDHGMSMRQRAVIIGKWKWFVHSALRCLGLDSTGTVPTGLPHHSDCHPPHAEAQG